MSYFYIKSSGRSLSFSFMYWNSSISVLREKYLMSMVMNLKPGVEMMILIKSLTMRRSTVGFPQSLG